MKDIENISSLVTILLARLLHITVKLSHFTKKLRHVTLIPLKLGFYLLNDFIIISNTAVLLFKCNMVTHAQMD